MPAVSDKKGEGKVPLVVDLDGTLTPADVSLEAFVRYARIGILNFFGLILWILQGRSLAKAMVARALPLDAESLPLRPDILAMVEKANGEGRMTILASASHCRNVARVAGKVGLFDAVIGSSAKANLKGNAKLAAIRAMVGEHPFDYVGDSRADRPIWAAARRGFSCGHVPAGSAVERITPPAPPLWRAMLKSLRPHQWAKNLLVFVPLVTAGQLFSISADLRALLAAMLFSLVASAIYQVNDILDIDADRTHATKRSRPLAAGTLSIPFAAIMAVAMLALAAVISQLVLGTKFTLILTIYLVLTLAYSFRLKAAMTIDVITLAALYTIRIIAGAAAIEVYLSSWLLLFSIFFFLSLGYLKRYTELAAATEPSRLLKGRGYVASDLQIVAMSGVSTGMVSILVMALFIDDPDVRSVYAEPALLWLLPLALLYWINRIWMMAQRGQVEGDPVSFAVRDPRSLAIGASMAGILVAARFLDLPI
jgi:4-hydroxybenzoate polyprenyltransferase/phosphoserine phosphatase